MSAYEGYRTEPNTGLETLKLRTVARRDGCHYFISGQKMCVYFNLFLTPVDVTDGFLQPR